MHADTRSLALHFAQTTPLLQALSEAPRQQIVMLLSEAQGLNVGQIAALLPLSRPAISHHLKVLREAGLVVCEKRGTENLYGLSLGEGVKTLDALLRQLALCV